jgi:hypothetical protein
MKLAVAVLAGILAATLTGCDSARPRSSPEATASPSPTAAPIDTGNWVIGDIEVNQMDGTKRQTISTGDVGTRIVICFKNGKLCGGNSFGVFITSPCWVVGGYEPYTNFERVIRIKFDNGKPLNDTWGISDDHSAIGPHAPKQFIEQLKKHQSLAVEFGCDRGDDTVVRYKIQKLQVALDSAGLKL